ncbi:hypothetical protein TELCIR_23451 [Teladorsagia circumcincta]|uniref:PiggyBac transposable element-derived protein domain-containing protein n=1 Tax=Teladorsagia circumcincta TaxID=45464 RepID=A0A2G9TB44_TELCI|nr:hypothetical protein TELCIR_23451 [Teladorsagia circumcincta]
MEKTNMYSIHKTGKCIDATVQEIRKIVGAHILMGVVQFPRLRMYWSPATRIHFFDELRLSRNRFETLRNNLHIVDVNADHDQRDKLWKVRPIISSFENRCEQLELEENLCIDESIIPFEGQLSIKQYVKGKPNPWGVKVFMLCGASGIIYARLYIKAQLHFLKICMDNTPLRMKCPLKSEKELQKIGRGSSDSLVTEDGKIVAVRWYDNKVVNMASNFVGIEPQDEVKRWDRKAGEYRMVTRPSVIRYYNNSMGGVDKNDPNRTISHLYSIEKMDITSHIPLLQLGSLQFMARVSARYEPGMRIWKGFATIYCGNCRKPSILRIRQCTEARKTTVRSFKYEFTCSHASQTPEAQRDTWK